MYRKDTLGVDVICLNISTGKTDLHPYRQFNEVLEYHEYVTCNYHINRYHDKRVNQWMVSDTPALKQHRLLG